MKWTRNSNIFLFTALCVLFLDQISKYLVQLFSPQVRWGPIIIHYSQNTGAAFGIFKNQTFILAIISLLVVGLILWYYPTLQKEKSIVHFFIGLLLGGTIGNGVDRILRSFVIDFIGTTFWPLFNVADAAITISVIGLVGYWSIQEYNEKKRMKNKSRI